MCEGQWRAHVRGVVEEMGAIHPYAPPSRTYMSVFKLAATLVGPIVILYLVVSVSRRSPQPRSRACRYQCPPIPFPEGSVENTCVPK